MQIQAKQLGPQTVKPVFLNDGFKMFRSVFAFSCCLSSALALPVLANGNAESVKACDVFQIEDYTLGKKVVVSDFTSNLKGFNFNLYGTRRVGNTWSYLYRIGTSGSEIHLTLAGKDAGIIRGIVASYRGKCQGTHLYRRMFGYVLGMQKVRYNYRDQGIGIGHGVFEVCGLPSTWKAGDPTVYIASQFGADHSSGPRSPSTTWSRHYKSGNLCIGIVPLLPK